MFKEVKESFSLYSNAIIMVRNCLRSSIGVLRQIFTDFDSELLPSERVHKLPIIFKIITAQFANAKQ